MQPEQLSAWRDAALILLTAEALLMGALVGAALYFAWQALRQVTARLRPVLFQVRMGVWRVGHGVRRAMYVVARPMVWTASVAAGVVRAWQVLGGR